MARKIERARMRRRVGLIDGARAWARDCLVLALVAAVVVGIGAAACSAQANGQDLAALETGLDRELTADERCELGSLVYLIGVGRSEPSSDYNGDTAVTAADFSAWVAQLDDDDDPTPPPPPPPPPPPAGGAGAYGDGWPVIPDDAPVFEPTPGESVINTHFTGEVIRGGVYGGRDIGLRFVDCTGELFIVDAVFADCRQGVAVSTTREDLPGLTVHFVRCRFVDNFAHRTPPDLPAQLGLYYSSGPGPRDNGIPTLGLYGCVFVNSGLGSFDDRDRFASMYHHAAYILGNAEIVARDCLFVNQSSQAVKAMGYSAVFERCAVVGGAIGFGIGQEAAQQDRTGRHQMAARVAGNLFYGLDDLPPAGNKPRQRLGWAVVLQSVDAEIEHNLMVTPETESQYAPAIRANRERDYPVSVVISDNAVLGYKHVLESFGDGQAWAASVAGTGNLVSMGTRAARGRSSGVVTGTIATNETAAAMPVLDVEEISRRAKAGAITAADVIADVRRQLEDGDE